MKSHIQATLPGPSAAALAAVAFALCLALPGGVVLAAPPEDVPDHAGALVPRKSNVPGVDLVVEVPRGRHPVTRASIDENGNLRIGRGQQQPPRAPRAQRD